MKVSATSVVLTLASMTVAGLLGGIHREGLEDFQRPARLGQAVVLAGDQTMTPLGTDWGQYVANPRTGESTLSPGRILTMRVAMETPGRRNVVGVRCFLRYRDGSVAEAIEEDSLLFPQPGFRQEGTVIFETSREKLAGAKAVCNPGGVITFREVEMVFDLGLDEAAADKVWAESSNQRAAWQDDTLSVLP